MKIIYDNIVFSLQKAGGISTYWFELSSRLMRDREDVLFIERNHENVAGKELNYAKSIKIGGFPLLLDRFHKFSLKAVNEKFIFHSSYNRRTYNKRALQVLTVHDFVHEHFYTGFRKFLHAYQKGKAISSANAIIAISENTKKDLLEFFPALPESRIKVIYNGVSEDFYCIQDAQYKLNLPKPYLLFVGSRAHYKNFDFSVKLVANLEAYHLVIVGSALNNRECTMLNSLLPNRWMQFQHISNSVLNELYNRAFALIYPSAYEGFGIPLVEAMKSGCPFIALNNSSIPEVAGEAGVLLKDLNLELFEGAVNDIFQNREQMKEKGFVQAEKFSWEKCYQATLQVYKDLYNS